MTSVPYTGVPDARIRRGRRLIRSVGSFVFFRVLLRLKVQGIENVPLTGPAIILINHQSLIDPVCAIGACRVRDMVPISKEELYHNPITKWITDNWGGIPIKRGEVDMSALKLALTVLKGPDMLLIAPEGTRHKEGMHDPKDGVAFMAQKSNAIVVPTGLIGTHGFGPNWKRLRRSPVSVQFGRPVRLKAGLKRTDYPRIMHELMYQIAPLLPEALRGDYADLTKSTMETIEYL